MCRMNAGILPDVASSERIDRETGANPVRSRHCDRESVYKMPLTNVGKVYADNDLESGELLAMNKCVLRPIRTLKYLCVEGNRGIFFRCLLACEKEKKQPVGLQAVLFLQMMSQAKNCLCYEKWRWKKFEQKATWKKTDSDRCRAVRHQLSDFWSDVPVSRRSRRDHADGVR